MEITFSGQEVYDDSNIEVIPLLLNVYDNEIVPCDFGLSSEQELESDKLKIIISNQFEESDWDLLRDVFHDEKATLIANYDVTEEDSFFEYQFPLEHLDNIELMINYRDIFPHSEIKSVVKDGVTYELLEEYCKNANCECNLVHLHIFIDQKFVEHFEYNYIDKSVSDNSKIWIIEQLREQYEGLNLIFHSSHLKVKCLYSNEMIKLNEHVLDIIDEEYPNTPFLKDKKIGRNALCPCGSGKKYKKCCLNLS